MLTPGPGALGITGLEPRHPFALAQGIELPAGPSSLDVRSGLELEQLFALALELSSLRLRKPLHWV